ncbi:hypothetical protein SS50377_24450 [Spironucleus salmonicida]|uniref:Uncharacterized protein n=1 Tax=Spironucleus salmonicida TaxID=348837 RepID=V6LQM0_9EUKA|nr:hypothetical protein SS50377_24450 [Spironucleus salmonicida]|eukprot:EST46001.1 Hypothetical protein SS50377_13987 [Spironucleus salmonicida]
MSQFQSIWVLNGLINMVPTRDNIHEIVRVSGIHLDVVLSKLAEANPMIFGLTKENIMEKVTGAAVQIYTVSYFARYLELIAEEQVMKTFRQRLFVRLVPNEIEDMGKSLHTNGIVIQLMVYVTTFRTFTAGQDSVIKKDANRAIDLLLRSGRTMLEAKWRVGRMLNRNLFMRPEVELMLSMGTVSVLPATIEKLNSCGPDFRFAVELVDWYLHNGNRFWAFPDSL